jgi:hypothetical protein
VSVSVNQPGVYGRIDIGRVPEPPVLVYREPMVIVRGPAVAAPPEPIYMHVPPGHAKNWRKHCRRYNACGQPVYFVRDDWYQRHYHPQQQPQQHGHDDKHGKKHGQGNKHGHKKHDN